MTGLLSTSGSQFEDWTAAYRLFSETRLDPAALFSGIRAACLEQIPADAPLCLSIDDALLPKTGPKIPGVGWRRDPQGPPFQTNLIRAQRVLQLSAVVPLAGSVAVRGVPVDFRHVPTPPKLAAGASAAQTQEHGKVRNQYNLSTRATEELRALQPSFGGRTPIVLSDARFTTKRFLAGLPAGVSLIGRVRKDARLFYPPTTQPARGRKRVYGDPCPTPEQVRKDEEHFPWHTVRIHAAGADHDCRIKVVEGVLWVPGGPKLLRLIVIAPLAYRPRQGAKLLYRDPAYLLCTHPTLSPQQIVQFYFWRWDIEVNFRDEKTLLGVGQAQVWNEQSCQTVPAFQVAAYSLLLLAATQINHADLLPPPKWRARQLPERISAQRLIQNLRYEVWGRGLGLTNFSGFSSSVPSPQKPDKLAAALPSAVLYAQN